MSLFGGGQSSGSSFGNTQQSKPLNPFAAFGSTQPAAQSGLYTASPTTSQPQSSGGPFGSSAISQPQQSGGLFGSTTAQPQQQGGLFGAAASQPQTGGLFGSTASQPQQSGGIFGATTQQSSGGLFGNTQQQGNSVAGASFGQNQNQNQAPKPAGGLFGSAQPSQPSQGTSLFGGMGQNQNQPAQQQGQQPSGGLFGGTNTQNKPTLSLFGTNNNAQNQQPQQQQQSSLFSNSSLGASTNMQQRSPFGNSTAQQTLQPQRSLFPQNVTKLPGTLTMGQIGDQNRQQTVPGVRIDVSNLRGTTRFNDLHEELQKQIEQIDAFIQRQIGFKEQCDAIIPAHGEELSTLPDDVEFVKTKLEATETALDNDSSAINTMKTIVQKDAENARIGFRAVENLKLPQQFHYSGIWHPTTSTISPPRGNPADRSSNPANAEESTDLVSYFTAQASELSRTLETYKRNISEIETHLGTVEASTMAQSQQLMFRKRRDGGDRSKEEQVRELAAVLREFEAGIIGVAGKVGQVREAVVDVVEGGPGGILPGRR